MSRRLCFLTATCLFAMLCLPVAALAQESVLSIKQAASRLATGGYVLMMRHAMTVPGIGDPSTFQLGQCETQRNLSEQGRQQARAIGDQFRQAGIRLAQVRSSQWCRCRETAELSFGNTTSWSALNSFFADRRTEPDQTRALHEAAAHLPAGSSVMWVTHQVNITCGAEYLYQPW